MLTITAIIRAKKGSEAAMRQALVDVAENVRANEPDTVGFFISQDASDPCVFTTYERFTDRHGSPQRLEDRGAVLRHRQAFA
jgi:quinol monooxygenase YgiN